MEGSYEDFRPLVMDETPLKLPCHFEILPDLVIFQNPPQFLLFENGENRYISWIFSYFAIIQHSHLRHYHQRPKPF